MSKDFQVSRQSTSTANGVRKSAKELLISFSGHAKMMDFCTKKCLHLTESACFIGNGTQVYSTINVAVEQGQR